MGNCCGNGNLTPEEKARKKVEKEKILQYPININNLAINILK